ncbi:MAG TPA: RnfH family protein [Rhodocyclaceae bacterium]|nr:RnfH family protein [Rhodocyclaceae bacterium]
MPERIAVAVVYAGVDQQALVQLDLPAGSTLIQAVEASGLLQRFPEIDLGRNKVGIFGKLGRIDSPLRSHDRVEIYRALIADPKEVRRRRAAEGKAMKPGVDLCP